MIEISIPKWYDYETCQGFNYWDGNNISIPKWYDYEFTVNRNPSFH